MLSAVPGGTQQVSDYFVTYPQQDYLMYPEYGLLAIKANEEDPDPKDTSCRYSLDLPAGFPGDRSTSTT